MDPTKVLQWGRVSEDAETNKSQPRGWSDDESFNGAASARTRKPRRAELLKTPVAKLQWGRVSEDAETAERRFLKNRIRVLQWGRVSEDAET